MQQDVPKCLKNPTLDFERQFLLFLHRANTDILLGKNCGLQTLMVGTGVHRLDQIRDWEQSKNPEKRRLAADYYIDALGDIKGLLSKVDL